ncbi:MAG: tRNA 5-methoxyuridine(34)/uridine 5-oxyacetic acid(34) synthase CmoB [Desulfobulbus sp.]|jgi:tRNA (mo5U34)-methyltransferase
MDLLAHFPHADHQELRRVLEEKAAWIGQDKKGFVRYRRLRRAVGHLRASSCTFSEAVVRIGAASDLAPDDHRRLHDILRGLMPWRKGPFSIFGIDIDAEWQSNRKWERIVPELPDLRGKIIADIGCNNGYYMFRMVPYRPALVVGFEPYVQHYATFNLLNTFAGQDNLRVELLGIEHLPLFPASFDVIFCLGILYHRPSPIQCLRDLYAALRPGGVLIIESQAIPGDEPVALFPARTYAKAPGTWFVPTASCLCNWLARCGFADIHLFCDHAMSSEEQRRTEWMQFESYQDFIDKDNPTLTIEGYPAPRRIFLKAYRQPRTP